MATCFFSGCSSLLLIKGHAYVCGLHLYKRHSILKYMFHYIYIYRSLSSLPSQSSDYAGVYSGYR